MEGIPEVVLNSGMKMPLIGMGTAAFPLPDHLFHRSAIVDAIELGYRHFDTASVYQSEKPLGDAIAEALKRGLISSRDELFITSKLWCTDAHSDLVLPALQVTLRNLGLDHVDLYLIHFPVRLKRGENNIRILPPPKEDFLPIDLGSTWEAMEECHKLGLAKSIGVSNFACKKLESLLAHARIPPAVNQVEMHPLWQQKKLRQLCDERVIHVSAWSPLGGSGASWGTNAVLDCPELKEIAEARGKSPAQVCLRWLFEQGVSSVPKSFNKGRLKENLQIFDWQLSAEELHKISLLPQKRTNPVEELISPYGPYKSLEELWDGEI